LIEVNY